MIAGEDPRPLLVLRECLTCTGTDDALLTRQTDNEKTMLMSRWFHCVKIAPGVLDEDHAFKNLFTGDAPAHLFLARADGSSRMELDGAQSRTELWGVMSALLDLEYRDKPDKALKKLYRVLDGFDDRLLADAHSGLMAVIDKYLVDQHGKPVRRIRHRAF